MSQVTQGVAVVFPQIEGAKISDGRTVIAMAGSQAPMVRQAFADVLQQRNMPGVSIQSLTYGSHDFMMAQKTISQGEEAKSVVRIEPYGNDLVVETRHYEFSQSHATESRIGGTIGAILGFIFFWTGIGFLVFFGSLGTLFGQDKFKLQGSAKEEGEMFRQAVKESILRALANSGISDTVNIKVVDL
jgi:hypothetical protein